MTQGCSVWSQLLHLVPRGQFARVVKHHHAEFNAKGFTCWEQFVAMLLCQVARRDGVFFVIRPGFPRKSPPLV